MRKHYLLLLILSGSFCISISSTAQKKDTPLRIVLQANENTFFKDYPLDTLVAHLNLMNELPGVEYSNASERQTGKNENEIWINLRLVESRISQNSVTTKEKIETTPTMRAITDAGGQTRYEIVNVGTRIENQVIESNPNISSYLLSLTAYQPETNKKLRHRQWSVKGDEDTELALIIKLIKDIQLFTEAKFRK